MKVALVYDRVNKWGGAERVLLALHELFPDAPLYTSVYNNNSAKWASEFDVKSSFLQSFPYAKSTHELYPLLMPLSFEQFSFDEYDLVISVTSEASKGIITKPQTKHICYMLTPTRYLWSGYHHYFSNPFIKAISRPAVWYLKEWDMVASSRPDAYIAISKTVQRRIEKYYQRESAVVYPPLMLEHTPSPSLPESDYFLIVSRLVPYKRIDLAVKACNELQIPLKIIGTGSEESTLKRMSGPTVEFLGALTDSEIVAYYRQSKGFLFLGNEDFGLTMVESLSFGKPVIAYQDGGAEEIITDKTGVFFSSQTVSAVKEAIHRFESKKWNSREISSHASKFSFDAFAKGFKEEIEAILA